ncbi:MAG: ATP-binding cassette subfamily B multidrug efflux pump [Patiriisocius sp.]|jgi:ATP-binding cassette subfamily B multidrug efflux pump
MSKITGKAFDMDILKRMLSLAKGYKKQLIITMLLILAVSTLSSVRPYLISRMIDLAILTKDHLLVRNMFILVVIVLLGHVLLSIAQGYYSNWIGQQIVRDMRVTLFRKINGFKLKYFDTTPVGTLVTRVISDIETINQAFSSGILVIVGELLTIIFVLGFMFFLNWKFTLMVLIPIPLLVLATRIFKNAIKKSFQDVRTEVSVINTFVQEHIVGMNIVQIFNREEKEFEKFQEINKRHRGAHIKSIWAYSVFFPVVEILSAVSVGLLIFWAVLDFDVDDSATHKIFSDVVAFILYIFMLYRPIRQLADRFNQLQMGMVGAERVFKILDEDAVMANEGEGTEMTLKGKIDIVDVSFAYNEPDWILQDLNIEINPGEMIAFVGSTGAGKSTILNLLGRFYEFQKGEILLDDIDIRKIGINSLRQNIAVVLQDVFLFSGSIMDNITLKNPEYTLDVVIEAAKEVGAHEFIMKLPGGYDFDVKERGAMLSVGQRQLISFIRAYVYKPRILILDEATSSVDSESEELIKNAQRILTKGRTSIVVAHRLSTVIEADRIIVLEKGRIIESGKHQELLEKDGHYKKLYDLQISHNEG